MGGAIKSHKIFDKIISLDNLFFAWNEFKKGKMKKQDVQKFAHDLEENIFALHRDLKDGRYGHSNYISFYICDPKLRKIHKATIQDRILHRAVYRIIEPIFDKNFIFDSYSSRSDKGLHKAVRRLHKFAWRLSKNNTRAVWILKCDIRKFFASIDQRILINLLNKKIGDAEAMELIKKVIFSFGPDGQAGIPLGNITSQLFANVYLNELDQFIKRKLRAKYYVRYADDFIILSNDKTYLDDLVDIVNNFLREKLCLHLHPQKVMIKKWSKGIDFLGYVSFSHHSILRTKTKKRMFKKLAANYNRFRRGLIDERIFDSVVQSYFGVLKHCRSYGIHKQLKY